MEDLIIESTKYTPTISFEASGNLSLAGKSYPENTFEFYSPVMKWMKAYFADESSSRKLTLTIEITYFNSSSSKLFFDFFDLLDENKDVFDITVNWLYDEDNESALEAGEDFIEDFEDLKINLVPKVG
jgi:hypothetical protein